MRRSLDNHSQQRRARDRARRSRCAGLIALVAMVLQLVMPLVHGPHACEAPCGTSHSVDHAGASGPVAGPQAEHDCDQCAICRAISGAAQPVVPTAHAGTIIAAGDRFEVMLVSVSAPGFFRVVTESGPRGPPIGC